jgi:lysozyme family protein
MSFETAFRFTIGAEGGYVNDVRDPGGETNWGISKRSYPDIDIKALTQEQAQTIYRSDYWQAASCERMPPKIAIAVFDAAVHHGPKTAIKLLQRALKVADDGEYGRVTHGTLQARDTNETFDLLLAQRAIYLTTCPAWPTYKLGWLKRLFNLARSNFA